MRLPALALATLLAVPAFHAPAFAQRSAPDSFADLAERLLPAVVNIQTTQMIAGRERPGPDVPQAPPGSPFEDFFRDWFDRNRPPGGQPPGQPPRQGQPAPRPGQPPGQPPAPPPGRGAQSLGSGFIIDPAGLVVTNNHVIDGAATINVVLQDNTTLPATLVGRDPRTDVALLRVSPPRPLPAVRWGNSDSARVGDWVLAIGNPFGLGGSVTAGIISARNRDIRQGPYDDFIQTDAAINRGNSGGPLFNMAGEVVGINTAIYSPSGGSIGIGFSVPSNLARNVVAQLSEFGRTRRGWLGVNIQQVTPEIAESIGLGSVRGALVAGVSSGGPAERGRLTNGDVVLRFDNQDIREMRNLPRIVSETPIGREVPVVVWRDGREVTLNVTVGELPEDPRVAAGGGNAPAQPERRVTELPAFGLRVAQLNAELRERFRIPADRNGVVVVEVTPNSLAAERGVQPGDVITEVAQQSVGNVTELQERIDGVRRANRSTVLMLFEGQGGPRWVPLPLAGQPGRAPGE